MKKIAYVSFLIMLLSVKKGYSQKKDYGYAALKIPLADYIASYTTDNFNK